MCANSANELKTQKHCAAFVIDESDKFDNNLCDGLSRVNLNIDIFGKELNLTIGFADVPVEICDIIPPAQALCDIIVKTAATEAKKLSWEIPFTNACDCCKNSIPLPMPEALWLNKEIKQMPNSERKVLQRSIELARRKQNLACPFLSENICMIYHSRPLACREHIAAGSNSRNASDNQNSRLLQLPVSILEAVICLCAELEENITEAIMLPAAISWAQNSKDRLTKTYHMSELLGRLVDIIHRQSEKNRLSNLAVCY
jgi:Fe-S-cluster containining protein